MKERKPTTMNSMNSQPTRQDLPTHLGDVLRSRLSYFQIVIFDRFQQGPKFLRNESFRPRGSTFEGCESLDRHDSRYDGDRDTSCSKSSSPIDEYCTNRTRSVNSETQRVEKSWSTRRTISIVKHLSKDNIGTSVDFLFQMFDLDLWTLTPRVTLWESRDSNIEVISIVLSDVLDEVDRVVESSFSRLPFFDSTGWVSS